MTELIPRTIFPKTSQKMRESVATLRVLQCNGSGIRARMTHINETIGIATHMAEKAEDT